DLIHTDLGPLRVEGTGVDFQHVFHVSDELPAVLGRDAPLLLQPGLRFVFLSVWRTVSWEIASTWPSWTNRSASKRRDQRAWPSGASLQARVMSCASRCPSSFRGCAYEEGRGRRAASKPSSTKRSRTRITVQRPTSRAWHTASSVQPG